MFLNHQQYTSEQLMWLTLIHLTFVLSALLLAYIDRITGMTKDAKKGDDNSPSI